MADIDLNSVENWVPIGYSSNGKNSDTNAKPFSGEFDGAGHSITGLKIRSSANCLGLFGFVKSTVSIHDLRITVDIDRADDTTHNSNIGAVVGAAHGDTQLALSNIIVFGSVEGYEKVGGIVGQAPQYNQPTAGYVPSISFTNCVNRAAVTGQRAGGILSSGLNARGTASFTDCTNYGTITDGASSNGYIAGIVGQVNAPNLGVTLGTNETMAEYAQRYAANTFLTVSNCSNQGTLVPSTGGTAYSLLNTSYSNMSSMSGSLPVKDQRNLVLPVYLLTHYAGNTALQVVNWAETDSGHSWLQGYAYGIDEQYSVMVNDGTAFTADQFNKSDEVNKILTINDQNPYASKNSIKLLTDLTWTRSYDVANSGKDIVIDLNNYTLSADTTLFTNNVGSINFVNGTIVMNSSCDVLIKECSKVTFENITLNAPGKTILQLDGTGGPVMGSSVFGKGVSGKIEIKNGAPTSVTFNNQTYHWYDVGGTMGTYTVTNGSVAKDAQ